MTGKMTSRLRAVLTATAALAGAYLPAAIDAPAQAAIGEDATVPLPPPRPDASPVPPPARPDDAATAPAAPPARPASTGHPAPGPEEVFVQPDREFAAWRADFRRRALAAGIGPQVFDAAFAGVKVNRRVLELDAYQPEFVRPLWEYLDSAVSETRIRDGRAKAAEHAATLRRIEEAYGVDAGIVAAIWGIESAYGFNYGKIPVIESLATLAFEGRRRVFAEEQLIAALRIQAAGDVTPARMVGSWAGAMGHTQFIPTSYEAYAVDFTGDGRRDVWAADPSDALASTANYLSRFGWHRGEPSVIEVSLPPGFDYRLADDSTRRSTAALQALGVRRKGAGTLVPAEAVTLLLPAGAAGPAFAVYPNFRVIKRYNNATSYALAAAMLAGQIDERIAFGLGTAINWPRSDRPLSHEETMELQRRLTALGYATQGVDGIVGPNTRSAIRSFQAVNGLVPDGYLSAALLARVRAAAGG